MNPSQDAPSPSFTPIEAVPDDAPAAEEKQSEAQEKQFKDSTVDSDPVNTYLQVLKYWFSLFPGYFIIFARSEAGLPNGTLRMRLGIIITLIQVSIFNIFNTL